MSPLCFDIVSWRRRITDTALLQASVSQEGGVTIANDDVSSLFIGSDAGINLGRAVQRAPRIHTTFNGLFGLQML